MFWSGFSRLPKNTEESYGKKRIYAPVNWFSPLCRSVRPAMMSRRGLPTYRLLDGGHPWRLDSGFLAGMTGVFIWILRVSQQNTSTLEDSRCCLWFGTARPT